MKIIYFGIENVPTLKKDVVLCLGFFDGVHKGHIEVIKKALSYGKEVSVMTFDKSPLEIFGACRPSYLTSIEDKAALLEKEGVSSLLVFRFDKESAALSKQEFMSRVLNKLSPHKIVSGDDYTFGQNGLGGPKDLMKSFDYESVELLKRDDKKVSTHEIIPLIQEGKIEDANDSLGYYYTIKGKVVRGYRNGHKIGFPTMNLSVDFPYSIPRNGVYIGYTIIDNHQFKSIINVGYHPTIDKLASISIESHLLNYQDEAYEKTISIQFVRYIRDEKKFNSIDELAKQLKEDKEKAKNWLQ